MAKEKNAGMSRRGLPKSAGGMGVLPKKMPAQMPPLVAANPLVGTIDMHVHAAPDSTSRALNDFELARRAKELGMRGVVIKNHEFITNDRAYLVRQVIPGIEVFGGIALNESVGGINPEAVDLMLKFTGGYGKIVWLPTHDSAHHKSFSARRADAGGIRVIDASGKVIPELRKVLKRIAQADVILATGHVSRKEVLACVKAARQEGVRKVLVTHAMQSPGELSVDDLKYCVESGAFIEHCYISSLMGPQAALGWMKSWKHISIEALSKAIKDVGAEHCVIASDLGQYLNPMPTDGMKEFILALMSEGITREQIDAMARENPARLLGLEPM